VVNDPLSVDGDIHPNTKVCDVSQRGRKIGRPGKDDGVMKYVSLESKRQRNSSVEFRYIKTVGLAGERLWSEHKTIKLLVGRGSCYETET
jgi:hypothetical protein